MKKTIFFMLAALLAVLASCGGSKLKPLEGNPNLVTFTEKTKDGLMEIGVADLSGHVIITPDRYRNIVGDEYTISCVTPTNHWKLFKVNGEYLGTYEMVTPWRKGGTYYLGVVYTKKTYYFPKEDLVITTNNAHSELEVLFLETADGWKILNFDGKELSSLPQSFTIVKDEKIPTKMWIAVLDKGKRPLCTFYTPQGEVYKKLTLTKWRKIEKNLSIKKTLTDRVNIATTKEFEKI